MTSILVPDTKDRTTRPSGSDQPFYLKFWELLRPSSWRDFFRLRGFSKRKPMFWMPYVGWYEFGRRHLAICNIVILIAAVLDTYFVYHYREVIRGLERNPVCLYLIECDPDYLVYFISAKLVATALVFLFLLATYRWRAHLGAVVVQAITLFQVSLISYQLTA